MTDNSILNMVGGEKHINPHYDIKEESANKGFTGIEVNGVRFSNIQEMLVYMDKQRNEIILHERENAELKEQVDALANVNIKAQNIIGEAKDLIRNLLRVTYGEGWNYSLDVKVKAEQFLGELK